MASTTQSKRIPANQRPPQSQAKANLDFTAMIPNGLDEIQRQRVMNLLSMTKWCLQKLAEAGVSVTR